MSSAIQHIWFDMEGTLALHTPTWETAHNQLLLETYAEVVHKQPSDELWEEYNRIYKQAGTHSAAFSSLGLPSDYWQHRFDTLDEATYYNPDERVYGTLHRLKDIVPISIFTNAKPQRLQNTLRVLRIESSWLTYTLTGDDIAERKPALDGFHKLVEMSNLPASSILYVGDRVQADIIPAKAVGIRTALVWGHSTEADYSFESIADILTLFKS